MIVLKSFRGTAEGNKSNQSSSGFGLVIEREVCIKRTEPYDAGVAHVRFIKEGIRYYLCMNE